MLPPTGPESSYFVVVEAHGAHAQVGAALVRFGVERGEAPMQSR